MNKKHKPERVVIEYNGMWQVSEFEKMKLPAGWAIGREDHNGRCKYFSGCI